MQKPIKEDPHVTLIDGMARAASGEHPSGAIEASEARGQQQLVASESIPTEWGGMFGSTEAAKKYRAERDAILVEMGFELGEPFPDDPLFRPAKLPEGWRKKGTGHAMHSDILDADGYERVGMFYKAAFYDRKASLSLKRRISVTIDCREEYDPNKRNRIVAAAMPVDDRGRRSFLILARFDCETEPDIDRRARPETIAAWAKLEEDAEAWVREHFPDYMNPLAYWSDELEGELVIEQQ